MIKEEVIDSPVQSRLIWLWKSGGQVFKAKGGVVVNSPDFISSIKYFMIKILN